MESQCAVVRRLKRMVWLCAAARANSDSGCESYRTDEYTSNGELAALLPQAGQ